MARHWLRKLDHALAAIDLRLRGDSPGLVGLLFHALFTSREEVARDDVDPYQPVLVEELRAVLEHFRRHGYRFVHPHEIGRGLDPAGRFAWLTFDDGYASNRHALPLLHELGIPATVFVATTYVREQRAFWWDALWRGRRRQGVAAADIRRETRRLKTMPLAAISEHLQAALGRNCQDPTGDHDRPLRIDELRELACDPWVTLGNHTADHAILPRCDAAETRRQMRACQEDLLRWTGSAASMIAYPDGACSPAVIELARREGFAAGAAVGSFRNALPLAERARMAIRRCFVPAGAAAIGESRAIRSRLQVRRALRRAARWESEEHDSDG